MMYRYLYASCTPFHMLLRNVQKIRLRHWPSRQKSLIGLVLFFLLGSAMMPVQGMGPRRFHDGETQQGLASWYGAEQGRHTASGERFDPNALTAAHRNLPFNTIIRVTNQQNGKSVDLRINDRGPFRGGRILDVSEAAADLLDMKRSGTVPVLIEIIELGSPSRSPHA